MPTWQVTQGREHSVVSEEIHRFATDKAGLVVSKGLVFRGLVSKTEGNGTELFSYYLEIDFSAWPRLFPTVREVDNRIEHCLDNHVYPDSGNFCLSTRARQQFLIRSGKISTLEVFWNTVLIPYLVRQDLYANGYLDAFEKMEYSHGSLGYMESYHDLLGVGGLQLHRLLDCYVAGRNQMRGCTYGCRCVNFTRSAEGYRLLRRLDFIDLDILRFEVNVLVRFLL